MDENFRQIVSTKMNSLDGGFGETTSSLTFQDPDEDDEVGVDTQADDFRLISHYHLKILGHKKNQKLSVAEEKINKKRSSKCEKKYKERHFEKRLQV